MTDPHDLAEFLARMPHGMGALNKKMGIELLEISPERLVGTMPVEGNTQPYGLLHGGASVVLAETLGSIGSALRGNQRDRHRYGDRDPPRSQLHLLRGGDHRRGGPPRLHLADHVRSHARREVQLRTGYSPASPMDSTSRRCTERRCASTRPS